MKNNNLSVLTLFLLLNFYFLASAKANQLKISSDPIGATVVVRDLNGVVNTKLGVTPYEGNVNDIASNFAKSNFFMIVIEKDGYETQSILVNDVLKSDLELKINLVPREDILHYRKLDKIAAEMFEAQRLMRASQFDNAIDLLKRLENEQPNLSIIPEFLGSAYYLKKELKSSLLMYEKAYRLNPDNRDAFNMKSYLRKALGAADEK